jgi:hypothetical protein
MYTDEEQNAWSSIQQEHILHHVTSPYL